MISLILTESSLELVPKELSSHPSVISHAQKLGKRPSEILLDNSWHFAAMKGISDEIKRGRPDLVHFCILEATTIPLYAKNKIKINRFVSKYENARQCFHTDIENDDLFHLLFDLSVEFNIQKKKYIFLL